jgi:methionyl-tRNA synthetase
MSIAHNVLIAPPPTPNGDLHVGHLSGPYLGVDVYRRYLALKGQAVTTALSVDLNQSYVVTTAQRLGMSPEELAHRSYEQVQATLSKAEIRFDVIGMPDRAYTEEISSWFMRLYDHGSVRARKRYYPFDLRQSRFLFESYATGRCPTCLSGTCANICEACGHPNEASELLGLHPTNGAFDDPVEPREVMEFYIDLELMRDRLAGYLETSIPEKRPALRRLIAELFARPLPSFPVTFPSDWGIRAPFPNAEGLCLNVWAEMVPGHFYWINQASVGLGQGRLVTAGAEVNYVQYLGFDNSFFYVFAHLALAMLARDAGLPAILPTAFITNEFYQLANFKFSTSQGHLIWGRDLLAEVPVDEVRFYLAWSNPEYNQANFARDDMDKVLEKKFRRPFFDVLTELESRQRSAPEPCDDSVALLTRFEEAYRVDRQSLRLAALTVANGLSIVREEMAKGTSRAQIAAIAQAVAVGLAPISPNYAEKLWKTSGASGLPKWPAVLRTLADPHDISAGHAKPDWVPA